MHINQIISLFVYLYYEIDYKNTLFEIKVRK